MLEECGGLDIIEDLQNHQVPFLFVNTYFQNIEIYEKALNILEMYFAAEENSEEGGDNDEEDYDDNCFAPPSLPQFGFPEVSTTI